MNSENQAPVAEVKKSKCSHPYFVVDRKVGKAALDLCLNVVNPHTVLPILESVLIRIEEGGVYFSATNLEISVEQEVKVVEYAYGISICVYARQLAWFFNKSKEETVRVEFDLSKVATVCVLKAGKFTIKLPTENSDNYPKSPARDYNHGTIVKTPELAQALGLAVPFTSNDDLRPSLTAVNVCGYKGILTVVSTDAHRLFYKPVGIPVEEEKYSQLYPKQFASLVSRYFSKGHWTLEDNGTYVCASKEGIWIHAKMIDARFPDWPVILPKDNNVKITVDRSALFSAIDLSGAFSNKSIGQVILTIHKDKLEIKGHDLDYSTESNGEIDAVATGLSGSYKIGMNYRFMLEALRVNKGLKEVVLANSENPNKAVVVDDCVIVMPLMIND